MTCKSEFFISSIRSQSSLILVWTQSLRYKSCQYYQILCQEYLIWQHLLRIILCLRSVSIYYRRLIFVNFIKHDRNYSRVSCSLILMRTIYVCILNQHNLVHIYHDKLCASLPCNFCCSIEILLRNG